jgi:hypothetical protein
VKDAMTRALLSGTLAAGACLAGCGDAERVGTTAKNATETTRVPTVAVSAARHRPIPRALRAAESAAEDTIDLALAGRRDRVVQTAGTLKAAADGPAGAALRAAGVSGREITEFRARADTVARLAPRARLLEVALASNRAFGLMAGFFARYKSRVPPAVTTLDYLDFEAKLQATADHSAALGSAVTSLDRAWAGLRPDVVEAGGARVAARFDAHVARMRRLAAEGGPAAAREAQHGLDLVDELEAVYRR